MAKKSLILIRHSYAENAGVNISDVQRKLTGYGLEVLEKVKTELRFVPIPQLCYLSPAKRTVETFESINKHWTLKNNRFLENEHLYHGNALDYLAIIENTPNDISSVAIVGHNPSVSYLASKLNSGFAQGFLPGCVLILSAHIDHWANANQTWEIEQFIQPAI